MMLAKDELITALQHEARIPLHRSPPLVRRVESKEA